MNSKTRSILIPIISIIVPGLVAVLYIMPKSQGLAGFDIYLLPAFNAVINSLTTLVLLLGFYFIKQGNIPAHKTSMLVALGLSVLFLISYVTYHAIQPGVKFGGEGMIRTIYFIVLLTHIVLAAAIVPLVLITLSRALSERFDKHRKIARITLPLWLYVTITGVVVYFMISPYYV